MPLKVARMGDIKGILKKFYVDLRENVKAVEIYRSIWGLTKFDEEQITSEKNNILAVDNLVDIIGRRCIKTFASFVEALKKYGNHVIADKIISETKQNYQQLYRVLLPTAKVSPSTGTYSVSAERCVDDSTSFHLQQVSAQTAPSASSNHGPMHAGKNVYAYRESITSQDTDDSDADNEPCVLTLDTKLCLVEYGEIEKWVKELRKDGQWIHLAREMKLNYQKVKVLEADGDPAGSFFHQHCSTLTIKRFMKYLTKTNIANVLDMVKTQLNVNEGEDNFSIAQVQPTVQKEENKVPNAYHTENNITSNKDEAPEQLNSFESIIDNTQVNSSDSSQVATTTNIGRVTSNKTPVNIAKVGNFILNIKSSSCHNSDSDKDLPQKSIIIEKQTNNKRDNVDSHLTESSNLLTAVDVPENIQCEGDRSFTLSTHREQNILTEPERTDCPGKCSDQYCSDLLGEAAKNVNIKSYGQHNTSSHFNMSDRAVPQIMYEQPENNHQQEKHPVQDNDELLNDADIHRNREMFRNIQDSIPNNDNQVE